MHSPDDHYNPPAQTELPVVYVDDAMLVLNKPAGLLTVPGRGEAKQDCLSKRAQDAYPEALIVHRLDRDTSGCLLLARNPKALKRFSAAFEARQAAKRYLGVVAGSVAQDEGTIELALSKISSAADGWRMIAAKAGKPAVTHWRKIAEVNGLTLVEFRPETGRTHQIRVHALKGLGAALVGDPIYGDGTGAKRTLLHAVELTVQREGKPPVHAVAPMPQDFIDLGFTPDV